MSNAGIHVSREELEEHEENGEKILILTPFAKAATQKIAGGLKIRDFVDFE